MNGTENASKCSWEESMFSGKDKKVRDRSKTWVNIGVAFHHWRHHLVSKGMKPDAELTIVPVDC